mgnify:CR=1 FL=1
MSKKSRILITGSTGMVGSNLIEILKSHSEYDLFLANSKNMNLLCLNDVHKKLEEFEPDFVVHCAGIVGGIKMNMVSQFKSLYENTLMGFNLVKALDSQKKTSKLINLGSSCIYPKDLNKEYDISDLFGGKLEPTNEGYALAKLSMIKLIDFYNDKNFIGKSIIPCNLFGKNDSFDSQSSHLIPAIIKKVIDSKTNKKPIEIWGDGNARREFSYVKNLALFIVNFIENFDKFPSKVNFGEERDFSVKEYYKMACKILDCEENFVFNLDMPVGMMSKKVNIDFQKSIGWKNKFSVEDGIEETYKYFIKL